LTYPPPLSLHDALPILLYAPHLGWQDVAVAERLRFNASGGLKIEGEGVPVIVENDATAAAVCGAKVRLRDVDSEPSNNFVLVRRSEEHTSELQSLAYLV